MAGAPAVTEPVEVRAGHRELNAKVAVGCSAWLGAFIVGMEKCFCDAGEMLVVGNALIAAAFEGVKMLGELECVCTIGEQLNDAADIVAVFIARSRYCVHAEGIPLLQKNQVHSLG